MHIGSGFSANPASAEAVDEALGRALAALEGARPELTVLFHSAHHLGAIDEIAERVGESVAPSGHPGALIGCTAAAVIGDGHEVEEGPALSIWTANLDGARVEPFALVAAPGSGGHDEPVTMGLPAIEDDTRAVLVLGDPYTFPPGGLDQLNAATVEAAIPVIGGMASGGRGPGQHALVYGSKVRTAGGVGVTISGDVQVETLVSQGCKPIGSSYTVTGAEGQVISSLGGEPPLDRLRDLFRSLSPEDQARMNRGLHVGVVIDEYAPEFGPGDFLIRNVLGADQGTGAIAVGEDIKVGQTVQFHIRDASAADEDLRGRLGVLELSRAGDPAKLAGALLFTCNGRGRHLFGSPDHDIAAVQAGLGPLPVAGMFCAGEIGPVSGRAFLHGFTASMALFVAPPAGSSPS
ncbi:MAG TPA: FIST N-terminal domain-containing protein [Actinomycetota bacterium]|nr:FIST N-terminal domain-containing protein [Actinomycetota bacterium]